MFQSIINVSLSLVIVNLAIAWLCGSSWPQLLAATLTAGLLLLSCCAWMQWRDITPIRRGKLHR